MNAIPLSEFRERRAVRILSSWNTWRRARLMPWLGRQHVDHVIDAFAMVALLSGWLVAYIIINPPQPTGNHRHVYSHEARR